MKTVRDIMVSPVAVIDVESTIQSAAKMLDKRGIGSLVVLKAEEIVGIITERDMSNKVVSKDLNASTTKVGEVMHSPIITITPDTTVYQASTIMRENKFRRLPILDDGKLIGIVTEADIEEVLWEQSIDNGNESMTEISFNTGKIFELASKHPINLTEITKVLDIDRKEGLIAFGWLAREDKLAYLDYTDKEISIKVRS